MRASLSLLESGAVEDVPEDAMELIEIAHRHCERLVRLVNDMLDVEKVESGHVHLVRAAQPLAPILTDAVAAMQGHARQAGVRIAAGPLPEVRAEVDGDRLTQVLTNLLSNAIKFSPAGAVVELTLEQQRQSQDGEQGLRIAVLDRGPGIPEEFRGRIFQRFAQSEEESARQQGSGLGLSISRNIVEAHGGRMGFGDREGGGTVFYVELPLQAPDAALAGMAGTT
jgi:signal transduction histidine kinase